MLKLIRYADTLELGYKIFNDKKDLLNYLDTLCGTYPDLRINIKRKISKDEFPIRFLAHDDDFDVLFAYEIVKLQ